MACYVYVTNNMSTYLPSTSSSKSIETTGAEPSAEADCTSGEEGSANKSQRFEVTASSAALSGSIDSHLDGTKSGAGATVDLLASGSLEELEIKIIKKINHSIRFGAMKSY